MTKIEVMFALVRQGEQAAITVEVRVDGHDADKPALVLLALENAKHALYQQQLRQYVGRIQMPGGAGDDWPAG